MISKIAPIVFRVFFAALSLGAVGWQLFAIHIPGGQSVVDFFSYFTNLGNVLLGVIFLIGAVRLARGRTEASEASAAVRGAAVVYIVFIGIVYSALLGDAQLGGLSPWVNVVCHFIMPIAGVVDWLVWPPRRRIALSTALWWLAFPAVYTVGSLVRGAVTGFYPYPFFHPGVVGGYPGVALYCVAMLVGLLALALLVRWAGNALGARSERRLEAARQS